jgi:membrane-bound serine protease (ClpP class)
LLFLPFYATAQTILSIDINASINPSTESYIHRSVEKAKKDKVECLLIHLNTPGGLLVSTRNIISDIMQSPIPVVVYISPSGAQSASAGVFITLSAHIAAMAPGTNIGAAHPVSMQSSMDSTMMEKSTNDAVAFIRSIAEKRGRNMDWAENTVRHSISITATEALNNKVIDLIAETDKELLNAIDGRIIQTATGSIKLNTKNALVRTYEMSFSEKMLNVISDPNIAYMLLMLGFFGIMFELFNPGAILPGIVGVISLILSLYSMHTLPINYAGMALIFFALLLFVLEIKIMTHGILAIGGIISLLLGSMILINTSTGEIGRISWSVIITITIITTLFFLFIIGLGIKAQKRKPVTGIEALIGETGESKDILNPEGMVFVHGELWRAESVSGEIKKGEKITVTGRSNFKLFVKALKDSHF